MTRISMIAALDEANGLGKQNQLLCHLPADLQHFKTVTMGKPIVMGRRTFESIGRPLPGRMNIVLSQSIPSIEGVIVLDSLPKVLEFTKSIPELMIIGGAQLYNEALGITSRLYITRIHHLFDADVFFPAIDAKLWQISHSEFRPSDEKNKYDLTYYTYDLKNELT